MARRLPQRTPAPESTLQHYHCAVVGYKLTQTQDGDRLLTYVESHLTAFGVVAASEPSALAMATAAREKIKEQTPGYHAWRVEVAPSRQEVVTSAEGTISISARRV